MEWHKYMCMYVFNTLNVEGHYRLAIVLNSSAISEPNLQKMRKLLKVFISFVGATIIPFGSVPSETSSKSVPAESPADPIIAFMTLQNEQNFLFSDLDTAFGFNHVRSLYYADIQLYIFDPIDMKGINLKPVEDFHFECVDSAKSLSKNAKRRQKKASTNILKITDGNVPQKVCSSSSP